MVGVPGRSKACHTCKQRRIRCDGELPTCRNCTKSRRICTGYKRRHAFILSQDMVGDGPAQIRPEELTTDDASGSVMVSRWRAARNQSPIPAFLSKDYTLVSDRLAKAVTLPKHVFGRNLFRDRLMALMMDSDFSSSSTSVYQTIGDRYNWLSHILQLPYLLPALENSLLAICMARLGQHTARSMLVQKSLELYTAAVADVRRAISTTSTQDDDQRLAACLSLLLYEAVECPEGNMNGYHTHLRGCLELLHLRGADAHNSGLARSTLQILRLHTVISNQEWGRKFLAEPEWLYLPWSSQPDGKTLFDQLVDILLTMPNGFAPLENLDKIIDPCHFLQQAWAIIKEGRRAEVLLEQWLMNFQAALPGPTYRAEPSKMDGATSDPEKELLFPMAFLFSNFIVGQSMVLYWVACMTIQGRLHWTCAALDKLAKRLENINRNELACTCWETVGRPDQCIRHFTASSVPHVNPRQPHIAAYNICQSAEYFLEDTTRGFGPAGVLPALARVKEYFSRWAPMAYERELEWIVNVIGRIHASGYGIAGAILTNPTNTRRLISPESLQSVK